MGRAAVSNWRKRYDDFPVPVGGTAASPQFDLEEVEQWLAGQGKAPAVADEDRLWRNLLAAAGDPAEALAAAGEHLLGRRALPRGFPRPGLDDLAKVHGPVATFDELWGRYAALPAQRSVVTPDDLADLMATVAGVAGGAVFDPACGAGGMLRAAARAGAAHLYGQDDEPTLTRLADLWLALNGRTGEICTGDSLRADAFPDLAADAVLSNLPFGQTNWGHEELGNAPWEFGPPPRTEPELAWAQHAIAHLRPGGRAVLLMPPSVATRRAGRRIRANMLRRGALRAVIALPPGAAPPHAVPLHLWILQKANRGAAEVLLLDTTDCDLDAAYRSIADIVTAFLSSEDRSESVEAHTVPVLDLLDEEVDLSPGRRHLDDADLADIGSRLADANRRLTDSAARMPGLLSDLVDGPAEAGVSPFTVGDLLRSRSLQILGPVRGGEGQQAEGLTLTVQDLMVGRPASGTADDRLTPRIALQPGDVVVSVSERRLAARVNTESGPLLGRHLWLLRPDPQALDSWFLAGHLLTTVNQRLAGSLLGTSRFDVRRIQLPRAAIGEQRRQGEVFRRLNELTETIREAAALGADITRLTADGLASGRLQPT
ncbi:HsdM family class I SAM-dependent methyltransferase [Micromonospora inositola]|uniref:HsdM family class I SAM-dependent methyltransferase n=1 Tax=Micromonospora inositola TaxID=47865 RepID=UPI001E538E12|nr:N-6 DNA methylase [Micromonospora inositola]